MGKIDPPLASKSEIKLIVVLRFQSKLKSPKLAPSVKSLPLSLSKLTRIRRNSQTNSQRQKQQTKDPPLEVFQQSDKTQLVPHKTRKPKLAAVLISEVIVKKAILPILSLKQRAGLSRKRDAPIRKRLIIKDQMILIHLQEVAHRQRMINSI